MKTIVTITGPTCSGKSTLARYLEGQGIPEVRSFTTRAQRPGESDTAYRFVSKAWVEQIRAERPEELIECVEFNGNFYGNTVGQFRDATRISEVACVVVEPNGVGHWAEAAKRLGIRHLSVFLNQKPQVLIRRFSERLQNAKPGSVEYELSRLRTMIDVEIPSWAAAWPYDVVMFDYGETRNPPAGPTAEQLVGFLHLAPALSRKWQGA